MERDQTMVQSGGVVDNDDTSKEKGKAHLLHCLAMAAAIAIPSVAAQSKTAGVRSNHQVKKSSKKTKQALRTKEEREKFPDILMKMLSDKDSQGIISWSADGESFAVLRKHKLVSDILPKYFKNCSSYSSFHRRLNRWGFRIVSLVTAGRKDAAYFHEHFRRDNPGLSKTMKCCNASPESTLNNSHPTPGTPPRSPSKGKKRNELPASTKPVQSPSKKTKKNVHYAFDPVAVSTRDFSTLPEESTSPESQSLLLPQGHLQSTQLKSTSTTMAAQLAYHSKLFRDVQIAQQRLADALSSANSLCLHTAQNMNQHGFGLVTERDNDALDLPRNDMSILFNTRPSHHDCGHHVSVPTPSEQLTSRGAKISMLSPLFRANMFHKSM